MKPTRWVPLVAIAAIAMAVGWVLVDLVERVAGRILGVPWLAAVALWVLALGVLGWTVLSRGRLSRKPVSGAATVGVQRPAPPMPPLVAARTAALALAVDQRAVDEPIEALIGITQQRATGDDQQPLGVPHGTAVKAGA